MSEFDERVRSSTAAQNMKDAVDMLRDLKSQEWEHQRTTDLIDRLHTVGVHVLHRLSVADRVLVTQRTLNDLEGPSRQFLDAVDQIDGLSSSDEPNYSSATDIADALVFAGASLPTARSRGTGEVFERASARFDQEAASSAALLAEQAETIRSQVDEHQAKLQQDRNNFQNSVSAIESRVNDRFSQAENEARSMVSEVRTTSDSLLSQVNEATERLEREITDIQEKFRNSEQGRADQFVASQNSRLETHASRDLEYREWLESIKEEIEGLRNQAKSMLEEAAGASTAEHYMKLREEQNSAANFWRWVGVGSLGFSIAVAIAVFVYYTLTSADSDLSIATTIGRYSIVFSSLILATYALRQSGHHRRREQDISRVANELILLWPFINRLPEKERTDLLRNITPEYFKGGLSAQDAGDKITMLDQGADFLRRRNRGRREDE